MFRQSRMQTAGSALWCADDIDVRSADVGFDECLQAQLLDSGGIQPATFTFLARDPENARGVTPQRFPPRQSIRAELVPRITFLEILL